MTAPNDGTDRPAGRWDFRIGLVTDPGRQRERNEDALAAFVPYGGAPAPGRGDAFFLVADGMGGHEAGDVASDFVARRIRGWFSEADDDTTPFLGQLQALLVETNRALVDFGREEGLSAGAGSTATLACVRDDRLHIAHVGDSRLYRFRGGALEQLTEDHSWVAEQRRAGVLDESEIADHPARHMLTECLGVGADLGVFTRSVTLAEGDRFLLCTDGLHGPVAHADLVRVLAEEPDPQTAARTLVAMANERSGPDNITAVVVHLDARPVRGGLDRTQPLPGVAGDSRGRSDDPNASDTPHDPDASRCARSHHARARSRAATAGTERKRPSSAVPTRLSNALMAAGLVILATAALIGERSVRAGTPVERTPETEIPEPLDDTPSPGSVPAEDGSLTPAERTDGDEDR